VLSKPTRINSSDRVLNMIQSNLANTIDQVVSNPLISGSFVNSVSLVSGLNTVNHKLGRRPLGFIITRKNANQNVWDTQDANTQPELTYFLNSSGTVTVDIYFF